MNIDLLTLNSHKIFGPKGVGALYIRNGVQITPWLHGGGQEKGFRSSTENLAGIVGFVEAADICIVDFELQVKKVTKLRDKLIENILTSIDGSYLNGHPTIRLSNNINIGINGLEGETIRLLLLLDGEGIAVSAGSACSSNKTSSASHVLMAIGKNQFEARGSVRISLGRFNTEQEIEEFTQIFKKCVMKLNPIFT
jgi:cysteine desulfurase